MHSVSSSTLAGPVSLDNSNANNPVHHYNKVVSLSPRILACVTPQQAADLHKVSVAKAMDTLLQALVIHYCYKQNLGQQKAGRSN